MKRTILVILGTLLGALPLAATTTMAGDSESPRVFVCHIPPGNPANTQTISVPAEAAPAHLQHGDTLGACPTACGDTAQCDDGNACTDDDCQGGFCAHTAVDCNDTNVCTDDSCDRDQGCVYTPVSGSSCDDGKVCTSDDTCVAGACEGEDVSGCCDSAADCDDGDQCTEDVCDPATGTCSNPDAVTCEPSGNECEPNVCNPMSGECEPGLVDCNDSDACTHDFCNVATGCEYNVINCDDGNACTEDFCRVDTGCEHDVINCDDDNVCTTEQCDVEVGCLYTDVSCDDDNLCTEDSCDPNDGCFYTPVSCDE